jgi:hypothetical protein
MGADGDGCNGSGERPVRDGGRADASGIASTSVDAGTADSPDGAPTSMIGEMLAQQDVGQTDPQFFDARFVPGPLDPDGDYGTCAGAAQTVGDCCYFPPVRPPGTQPFSSGDTSVDKRAGVVTLVDTTSTAKIGTFTYDRAAYPATEFATTVWQPGDVLTVSATGDQVGPFTVSATTLVPPTGQFPPAIQRTQDFQITWQPDPNAEIMNLWISDGQPAGGGVNCTLPDANGSVTVDASLFAAFQSGAASAVSLGRIARQRVTPTSAGIVEFTTRAYAASVNVSVQ